MIWKSVYYINSAIHYSVSIFPLVECILLFLKQTGINLRLSSYVKNIFVFQSNLCYGIKYMFFLLFLRKEEYFLAFPSAILYSETNLTIF